MLHLVGVIFKNSVPKELYLFDFVSSEVVLKFRAEVALTNF